MPTIIFPFIDVLNTKKTKSENNIQYDKCINLSQEYQKTFNIPLNKLCEFTNITSKKYLKK